MDVTVLLGSAGLRHIPETTLPGGRVVRVGDEVSVLTTQERMQLYPQPTKLDARTSYESVSRSLKGTGPFKISWIGLWPCGRVMLYLKILGREPGAYATDFK